MGGQLVYVAMSGIGWDQALDSVHNLRGYGGWLATAIDLGDCPLHVLAVGRQVARRLGSRTLDAACSERAVAYRHCVEDSNSETLYLIATYWGRGIAALSRLAHGSGAMAFYAGLQIVEIGYYHEQPELMSKGIDSLGNHHYTESENCDCQWEITLAEALYNYAVSGNIQSERLSEGLHRLPDQYANRAALDMTHLFGGMTFGGSLV